MPVRTPHHESREQRAKSGTPAPLLTFCASTFPAACLGCSRTLLTAVFALASLVVLSSGNALAQTVNVTVNICDRTTQVRDAILAATAVTVSDCTLVPASELAAVTDLDLEEQSDSSEIIY